ncbi:MAG TPA: agmatinase [Gemmatimonadaceae bacterium]|nr:agmatinase [Gemmatimonadaceae bacterium]
MPNLPNVALLGVPFDARSSFLRGTAQGPAAIRVALASPSTNTWSESVIDVGEGLGFVDAGDVAFVDGLDERQPIETAVDSALASGRRLIALGGDHSITYPLVASTHRARGKFSILHFDAHPDLYPEYDGDRYSHACPFARILEDGLTDRLVQVGIRTMNDVQREQADRHGVEVIDMAAWARGERPSITGPVYISIDMDGFDPAFAPGVSHREPGGLSARDVIAMIQRIAGPIVGADVVELNPSRDPLDISAPLAAKLVKELVARMAAA